VSVLIVAEHLRGQVRPITLELVSAAKELGEKTAVAVIAKDPASIADQVDVEGVNEIVSVKVEQEEFENDVYLQAVEQLISDRSPDVILVGFTVNGMGYAPALAAKLGIGFASDVFALRRDGDDLVAERSFYGSKVNAEIDFPGHDRVLLMIRPTSWQPAEGDGATVEAELEADISGSRASGAALARRKTSVSSRGWPTRWARRSPSRDRSSTRVGCRTRGRSASPARP
jgi:electron transfer flavoprotein alpha subunit